MNAVHLPVFLTARNSSVVITIMILEPNHDNHGQ